MKITELIDKKSVALSIEVKDKNSAISYLVDLMDKQDALLNKELYFKAVLARENESTTAVGEGVAIPHAQSEAVRKVALSAMTIKNGVDFDAPDGEKVSLAFLIAAPKGAANAHIDVLSKLSTMLMNEDFTKKLLNAKSVEEFLAVIDEADKEEHPSSVKTKHTGAYVLAVTACPTGIAHTYMAAEKLTKVASSLRVSIKIETRGAVGVKNALNEDDIKKACAVIIAADTNVPLERFDGKRLYQGKVQDGIGKAEQLIKDAINGKYAIYHAESASQAESVEAKQSEDTSLHSIYMHLMNGVSHMLPLVVGGGILIALAFLIDGLSIDLSALSPEQRGSFGSINPVARVLKNIGGGAFSFMLPVLAAFIASSIADRPGLAAGFVGGYIAATGKSGFIGALIAGFAAGHILQILKKVFRNVPKAMEGLKPILIFPLIGIALTGLFMMFVVEPPIGWLNTTLNTALNGMSEASSIVLGLILGGMMAVDMGGPVNKAAYVFGSASIAAGNYHVMAAVMIGGMVPPLAIALSCMFFKSKYTPAQIKSAPANIVMGLSFITEGAIPFAAEDPLHVLPACIVGSALSGAISMAAGCTLMAPHGGIFVFPVVGHPLMYIVALLAGSIVSAVLLGIFKKTIKE